MKGAANMTKDASPTPTAMRAASRLQKSQQTVHAHTATTHTRRPDPTRRKATMRLLRCAKMGLATMRPTMNAAGRQPSWNVDSCKSPCSAHHSFDLRQSGMSGPGSGWCHTVQINANCL
jgi:hypothetical protein